MTSFLPKNILITGASSGIGAALAEHYATEGVTLALTGRDEARLRNVAQICSDKNAVVVPGVLDVTSQGAMAEWIKAQDQNTPFDLVVANAGISGGTGGGETGEPFDQVRNIFDINVTGVFNTVEPVLPRMVARKSGQIAIMSSLASFSGWPGAPAYSASKGAVRFYGEALRGSMALHNVKVNVICPGFIKTPMTDVNGYKMPFLMDVHRAAQIIAKALQKNKGRIAFPWQTYCLAGFFGMLPYGLSSAIFRKLPAKPQFGD